MVCRPHVSPHKLSGMGVPLFWPMAAQEQMAEQGLEAAGKNLALLVEEDTIQY
jgi:hypothetical protein